MIKRHNILTIIKTCIRIKVCAIYFLFKKLTLLFLLFINLTIFGQTSTDTINRRDANKKKIGYWAFYLDAQYNKCPKKNARYVGYVKYTNGKIQAEPIGRENKKERLFYKEIRDTTMRRPSVLNGELFTFFMAGGKEKLRFYEQYQNGRLTVAKEFFYQESDTTGEVNVFYYDSLFNNIPTSYLFYKEDKRIPLYTQYVGRKKTLSNVKYLVKHNDFKFKYRPILGYSAGLDKSKDKNLRTKDFLELGITRRYLKGVYIDTTKKTYHDKFGTWHAFNFSFLGNISKGQFLFGQKLTYSYSFSLLRVEAGLINYTNFTKNDLRLMVGLGLSAIGYFNESIQFSVPLTSSPFQDIGRVTLCIFIN